MSAGEVTPTEANTALAAIRAATEISVISDLEARIAKLEEMSG
jgi:hypothetical protein